VIILEEGIVGGEFAKATTKSDGGLMIDEAEMREFGSGKWEVGSG
jgi:hypothetical protein